MKYLIDTHTFIWYANGDSKLSTTAKEIIDSNHEKFISLASLWEMAIKVNIGKLTFTAPFEDVINKQIKINNYKILPIRKAHLFKLINLNLQHRDPFDRMMICQALVENIPIITIDKVFHQKNNLTIIW